MASSSCCAISPINSREDHPNERKYQTDLVTHLIDGVHTYRDILFKRHDSKSSGHLSYSRVTTTGSVYVNADFLMQTRFGDARFVEAILPHFQWSISR